MNVVYKDYRNLDANGKPTVATPAPVFEDAENQRKLSRILLGGTGSMIANRKTLVNGVCILPQHPGESDGNYKVRDEGNTLDQFYGDAINKAKNRIMSKPIALKDTPPELEALLEDIDLQGRDLNSFAIDVLNNAFADGIAYVLVDKPQAKGVKTVADAKAAGIRPYALIIPSCCMLDVQSELQGGKRVITLMRFMECIQVKDGQWGYKEEDQVRVLARQPNGAITFEVWKEREDATTKVKEWYKDEEGQTGMDRIALVPVYTNRTGWMLGTPPFHATAELNLDHWRVKSEQKNALTMNCFEMLAATGVDEKWSPEIGPAKVQRSENEQAKFYYLSPTGSGVTLAASYLEGIEKRINSASATLRVENAGKVTATASALDSEEGTAGLKAVAEAAGDAFELIFAHFLALMGLDESKPGDVDFNTDFGARHGTDTGLQELSKARDRGDLSAEEWVMVMQWRGELDPDMEIKGGEPPKLPGQATIVDA